MSATETTYSIRMGDDSRWMGGYSIDDVESAAMALAEAKYGSAQVRCDQTGERVGQIRECVWVREISR